MLDTLNRHLMHPLMAWREGKGHLRHLRTLERTQFDPPEVVRARQLAALKVQLKHAHDTVPYYRAAWERAGRASAWLRRHQLLIQRVGGILLVVVGVMLLTGLWESVMVWLQTHLIGTFRTAL